jgi:hypothetical protein
MNCSTVISSTRQARPALVINVRFGSKADICSAKRRVHFARESRHSTLRHDARRIRLQVSQQNALIEFAELTIDLLQPVSQVDMGVDIERGGFGIGKREWWPLGVSKPDITLRVYAHRFQKDGSKAAAAINAIMN